MFLKVNWRSLKNHSNGCQTISIGMATSTAIFFIPIRCAVFGSIFLTSDII